MRLPARPLLALMVLVAVACGTLDDDSAQSLPVSTQAPSTSVVIDATSTTKLTLFQEDEVPDETSLIEAAIEDLAKRMNVPTENVEVVETKQVEWPDGAIGCPEDGISYTQAIVEGAQVLLTSDGRLYDYHAGSEGQVFLCASDEKDGGYEFVPPPGFDD